MERVEEVVRRVLRGAEGLRKGAMSMVGKIGWSAREHMVEGVWKMCKSG